MARALSAFAGIERSSFAERDLFVIAASGIQHE